YLAVMSVLIESWDAVAAGYDRYWVPRFHPWIRHTVAAPGVLPPGPIAVPCCGTGAELVLLAQRYPEREIVGFDLSPGMVAVARAQVSGRVTARVADASRLPGTWAGVVSCFGLQQLPDPPAALASWCAALRPGGRLAVALWTADIHDDGPFDALRITSNRLLGASDQTWNARLGPAVQASAELCSDDLVQATIHHDSPEAFWRGMVAEGPWQARARRHPEVTAALEAEFLATWPPGPLSHTPHARIIVAQAPLRSGAG
ncbi:MAG: trans-aconitate methyltransferase, partial [Myxococcota bacterium]